MAAYTPGANNWRNRAKLPFRVRVIKLLLMRNYVNFGLKMNA
jgi:hypothetical protein